MTRHPFYQRPFLFWLILSKLSQKGRGYFGCAYIYWWVREVGISNWLKSWSKRRIWMNPYPRKKLMPSGSSTPCLMQDTLWTGQHQGQNQQSRDRTHRWLRRHHRNTQNQPPSTSFLMQDGIPASETDKKDRIRKYGKNDPLVKDPKTLWDMVMENFEDPTIQILCFAALVSLILGVATHGWAEGWLEGVSILLAVTIITIVTAGNNYMK